MRVLKAEQSTDPFSHGRIYSCKLTWLQLARPITLSGTISPILAGTGLAALDGRLRYDLLFVLLVAAILVQTSANMFNDYFDFRNGQDKEKWQLEEAKASSRLPVHHQVPYIASSLIGVAMILGLWISSQAGWWIAVVGSIGIAAGIAYSAGRHSLAALGLGEVTAGLFLGMTVTLLSYSVQTQAINWTIMMIALLYAMLISTMILTNNLRDIQKDKGYRRTLAMRLGRRQAEGLLTVLLFSCYLLVLALVIVEAVPAGTLFVLLAIPIAIRLRWSFRESSTEAEEKMAMKWAGRHHWVFGLLFAAGILTGLL
ncbi:prenyltransferase [Virgibacillus xinjiangensis]|uniref:Prenyltransferase n=1 Tax=Virgibacillus xinjiangensis TaxID=393090 RepID=A0ABV7CVY3_9BACI